MISVSWPQFLTGSQELREMTSLMQPDNCNKLDISSTMPTTVSCQTPNTRHTTTMPQEIFTTQSLERTTIMLRTCTLTTRQQRHHPLLIASITNHQLSQKFTFLQSMPRSTLPIKRKSRNRRRLTTRLQQAQKKPLQ